MEPPSRILAIGVNPFASRLKRKRRFPDRGGFVLIEERANGNKEMTVVLSYVKQLAASALQKQVVLLINLLRKGLTQVVNGDGGSIFWAPVIVIFVY